MERTEIIEELLAINEEVIRIWKGQLFALAKEEGLTPAQFGILATVKESETIITKKLADFLHQTPSAISQLVDVLVEGDYVAREPDSKDRRIVHLRLTNRGEQVIQRLREKRRQLVAETAEPLTLDELRADLARQRKVLAHIKQRNASK